MLYLLNSAVITAPGTYRYTLIKPLRARELMAGDYVSTIGYQETADAMTRLFGLPVAVRRTTIQMAAGDQAVVFRLMLPPGAPRIAPGDKGRIGDILAARQYEIGHLERLS